MKHGAGRHAGTLAFLVPQPRDQEYHPTSEDVSSGVSPAAFSHKGSNTSMTNNGNRKPITLSTKPLSTFSPVEDELDEEDFAQAVTA